MILPVEFPFNKKQARMLLANEKNDIVKNSIWSTIISYMGYAGYLNPFTLEAQVNEKIVRDQNVVLEERLNLSKHALNKFGRTKDGTP